jgi:uncharacterized protein YciI
MRNVYGRAMADYYLVEQGRGPDYDPAKRRRDQAGWDEHATFMDTLAERGVVVLGGPVGEVDGEIALLMLKVESEAAARAVLAPDPWLGRILTIAGIRPWTIWLRGKVAP